MNKMKLSFLMVVGLSLLLSIPTWANFQAGIDAYNRGDYDTARKALQPLADQGYGRAQTYLGLM